MDYLGNPTLVTHCEESIKLGREYWRCFTTGYEKGERDQEPRMQEASRAGRNCPWSFQRKHSLVTPRVHLSESLLSFCLPGNTARKSALRMTLGLC